MGETDSGNGGDEKNGPPTAASLLSMAEDLNHAVVTSARSLHLRSSDHLHSLQEVVGNAESELRKYEDCFFNTVKEEIKVAREHPVATLGIGVAAAFLLSRRPRRFLFRQTFGRFQSEEARFVRAEKNVKEVSLSVDLVKNESKKLVERASLAERDMKYGHTELLKAGRGIQHLSKSVYKAEAQAAELMDVLRETPGREALKLRAEVASVLTHLRRHKAELDKRIIKISDLGLHV